MWKTRYFWGCIFQHRLSSIKCVLLLTHTTEYSVVVQTNRLLIRITVYRLIPAAFSGAYLFLVQPSSVLGDPFDKRHLLSVQYAMMAASDRVKTTYSKRNMLLALCSLPYATPHRISLHWREPCIGIWLAGEIHLPAYSSNNHGAKGCLPLIWWLASSMEFANLSRDELWSFCFAFQAERRMRIVLPGVCTVQYTSWNVKTINNVSSFPLSEDCLNSWYGS